MEQFRETADLNRDYYKQRRQQPNNRKTKKNTVRYNRDYYKKQRSLQNRTNNQSYPYKRPTQSSNRNRRNYNTYPTQRKVKKPRRAPEPKKERISPWKRFRTKIKRIGGKDD